MPPHPDRDFAGYRIVRPLELGERASVWEAEDLDSGDSFAIETLAGPAAGDDDVREWFAEAWESVADIDHPNVVGVAELGEQDGIPFAVRAPAGASTLAKRVAVHGTLDDAAAVALIEEVGGALEAAHDAGVVHGDLSPASIILAGEGREETAFLTGFGRAEGDRREDVRDLGVVLAVVLGEDEAEGSNEELHAVPARAAENEFRTAAELVAAVRVANGDRPERDPAPAEARRGSSKVGRRALALLAVVAIAIAIAIVSGGDEEEVPAPPTDPVPTTSAGDITSEQPTTTIEEPPPEPGAEPAPVSVDGFPVGVSARDTTVYASTRDGEELRGFDQESGEQVLGPIDLGGAPDDLTIVDGIAWASLPDESAVARVELAADPIAPESIATGEGPAGLTAAFGSLWVVNSDSADLSTIPLEGGDAVTTPLEAEEPRGIAFGLGSLWVTDAAGEVLGVDPDDPAQQEAFEVGAEPRGVIVVDDHIWVANSGDGSVTELDPESGESRDIDVGGSPRDVAATDELLWVSNADGYVSSVDLESGDVERVEIGGKDGSPQGIAVGESVWVTTGDGDTLVAVAPGR